VHSPEVQEHPCVGTSPTKLLQGQWEPVMMATLLTSMLPFHRAESMNFFYFFCLNKQRSMLGLGNEVFTAWSFPWPFCTIKNTRTPKGCSGSSKTYFSKWSV
jgi:hypothetical protein